MNQLLKISQRYLWLIGLIPIYLYFRAVFIYSQNIPHWDDYAIIAFVNKFNNSDSFIEKFQLIFAQHNEHRIAFTRVIALLITKLNGSLNFQWMIWFGNFGLIGILYVFYRFVAKSNLSLGYLLPICFLIFQFSLFENTFWGMASVQNFWVIFFVLFALLKISEGKIPYLWAFLAAFTSANGVLLVPLIGFLAFLFLKDYRRLLLFTIFGILLIFCYFISYQKLANSQPIVIDIYNNSKATLMQLGSVFDLFPNYLTVKKELIATLFGFIILSISFLALLYKYLNNKEFTEKNRFLFIFLTSVVLFVAGTCLLTSITRLQYGFYVFLTSKYKIYSILAVCSLFILLNVHFKYLKQKINFLFFALIAIFVNFMSNYNSMGEIKNYKKSEIAAFYNGWHNGDSLVIPNAKSCFQYQKTFLDSKVIDDSTKMHLGKVLLTENRVVITNSEYFIKGNNPENGAYLEFISADKRYLFATIQEKINSKKAYLIASKPFYSMGFKAEIPLTELPTNNYFINILDKTDSGILRIATNYYIEIEGITPKKVIQNW